MTHLGLLIKVLILGLLTFHINSVNVIRAKYCWDRETHAHTNTNRILFHLKIEQIWFYSTLHKECLNERACHCALGPAAVDQDILPHSGHRHTHTHARTHTVPFDNYKTGAARTGLFISIAGADRTICAGSQNLLSYSGKCISKSLSPQIWIIYLVNKSVLHFVPPLLWVCSSWY